MDKQEKQFLSDILFDSVTNPIGWRPNYLNQIEKLIESWVARDVERELKQREMERTDDGC